MNRKQKIGKMGKGSLILCLINVMRIIWPVKIINKNLQARTNYLDIRTILKKYWCRFIGYVLRIQTNNVFRVSPRWTREGKRKRQGRPGTTSKRLGRNERCVKMENKVKNREEWKKVVISKICPLEQWGLAGR